MRTTEPIETRCMWWDAKFNLRDDGDALEQLWWPLVCREFGQYECFWTKHIVPLTNRIDPSFSPDQPDWVSFRSDDKISEEVEKMAMAQYSTFYFVSRSISVINYEPHLYMEDAFLFLDLAIKNAGAFTRIWRNELSFRLGIPQTAFPADRLLSKQFAKEVSEYRNVISHAPKIGRSFKLARESLPKRDHLERAEKSWRYVQSLDQACFEDGRKLLRRLLDALLHELDEKWNAIEGAVEPRRQSVEYRMHFNLSNEYCISGKARSR